MQSGGEALERYSLRRASSALEQLLARAPRHARRKEGAQLVEIDVAAVRGGDTLVLRPGDLIPVVGALLQEAIDVVVILNALRALGGNRALERGVRMLAHPHSRTAIGSDRPRAENI